MSDTTIKPASAEEKFEIMKARLIERHKWNGETEQALRTELNLPFTVEELVKKPAPAIVEPAASTKRTVKKRRISKKK